MPHPDELDYLPPETERRVRAGLATLASQVDEQPPGNARARRSRTLGLVAAVVAGLLVVPGVVALQATLGGSDDASETVSWRGTEYVVMWSCPAVRADARGAPERADYRPAAGGRTLAVLVSPITGLDSGQVIAVAGPPNVVCPSGVRPGHSVAFSAKTSFDEVTRQLAPLIDRAPN